MSFNPIYTTTNTIINALVGIESVRDKIKHSSLTPNVLKQLRETARFNATHYSTYIEGNKLTLQEVIDVLAHDEHIAKKKRDEWEVRGYYAALNVIEKWAQKKQKITEADIQMLHALVMGGGATRVKATPYRDGQNVIRDSASRAIVYLPPEAKDVPELMKELVNWINQSTNLSAPIVAGIAHYQFATIHPYYDGNGRTARLLATYILHKTGYDLKGLYSLEEYYAVDLPAYYQALTVGPSHNYYEGRAESDITPWVAYFCKGVALSFARVIQRMELEKIDKKDQSSLMRSLSPQQRIALTLFAKSIEIITADVAKLFGFKMRTASALTRRWVEEGFLEIADPSKKGRKFILADKFKSLID